MYSDFLPPALVAALSQAAVPVEQVPGLSVTPSLLEAFPDVEDPAILEAVVEVYREVEAALGKLLKQRRIDRSFVDAHLLRKGTGDIIGAEDADGRVVVGPAPARLKMRRVSVPEFMAGPQVTLFGPPDSAKMSINAMNSLHRRLPGEDPLVAKLVSESGHVPRWGADSEDSKTPMAHDLRLATRNLKAAMSTPSRLMIPSMASHIAWHQTVSRCLSSASRAWRCLMEITCSMVSPCPFTWSSWFSTSG